MAITPENLLKHELIGLKAEVLTSNDRNQKGLAGKVIGETKNTLILRTSKGEKIIQKKGAVFKMFLESCEAEINGAQLAKSPEERTKSMVKKW